MNSADTCLRGSSGAKWQSMLRSYHILSSIVVSLSAANANITVGVADSMTRISPYRSVPSALPDVATIRAARGEKQSFQVLVWSPLNQTLQVSVTPSSAPGAEPGLPNAAFSVAQVGYMWVTNSTDPTRTFPFDCPAAVLSRGGCWVPDPLLPLPVADGGSMSMRAVANMTMLLWVTLSVPLSQPAGLYHGTLQLSASPASLSLSPTAASAAMATISVGWTAEVFAFALPAIPYLKNAIQLDAAHLHRSFPLIDRNNNATAMHALYSTYAAWVLAEARLNPGSIYDTWKPGHYTEYNSPLLSSADDLARLRYGARPGLNSFSVPPAPMNATAAFMAQLRARNLSRLVTFYAFDEYNGDAKDGFAAVAQLFCPLKKAFPEARTLTTAHLGTQYDSPGLVPRPVPFTSETMRQLCVDAVVPQTNYLPPLENISAVRAGGTEVWTYVSMQPYKPYADWRLDNPLVDCRALFWQLRAYGSGTGGGGAGGGGFDGLLHWGLNQWSGTSGMAPIPAYLPPDDDANDGRGTTGATGATGEAAAAAAAGAGAASSAGAYADLPFVPAAQWNPATYATGALTWLNGDGKLLYSGEVGPVGSIRLANIRDGVADYDYLAMLAAAQPRRAAALLRRVAGLGGRGAMADAIRNATALAEMRLDVARALAGGGSAL